MNTELLAKIIEAAIFTSSAPLSKEKLKKYFTENQPSSAEIDKAIKVLEERYVDSGMELQKVASGWRFIARSDVTDWLNNASEEKAQKYSRALLETLALIAYRQPITRGEVEDVRGVAVSANILRTLLERGWVKSVGHKEVPGRPVLYATTPAFLDYFNLQTLSQLPALSEVRDFQTIGDELFNATEIASDDYTSVCDADHGDQIATQNEEIEA